MKAKIRGTEIYFDIAGMQLRPIGQDFIERPVLFVLHGGPGGDHLRFKQHSLALQEVAQMVFIDHRGCGRSKKTRQKEYTLENNIEDIEALRKHLCLEKIAILGTSYGGMVAQGYAVRYPKNVEKLILVATAPSYQFMPEAKKFVAEHCNAKQAAFCEFLWKGSFKNPKQLLKFFELMEPFYSVTTKTKARLPYGKSKTIWNHEAVNEGFGGFLRRFNFVPKLHKIQAPTLILAGENDWICSAKQSKLMAKCIPNAQLKIYKKCGHAIAVDAHEKYIKAIKKFLK